MDGIYSLHDQTYEIHLVFYSRSINVKLGRRVIVYGWDISPTGPRFKSFFGTERKLGL